MLTNNIDVTKYSVEDFLNEYKSLQIPYYQREYRWGKEEVYELINDIYNNINDEYFLGSFVVARNHSDAEIVDGQQRITTLLLIYSAMSKLCNEKNIFESTRYVSMSKNENNEMQHFISNTCHFANYSSEHYYKNYSHIEKIISKIDIQFLKKQLKKVVVSRISLPQHVDRISFFSQLNSTGRELTDAELIKSYIYTLENVDFKEIKYKLDQMLESIPTDKHDDFYRHFIAYKTGSLENKKGKKIFRGFRQLVTAETFDKYFDELLYFGVGYQLLNDSATLKKYPLLVNSFDSYCILLIEILLQNSLIENYVFSRNDWSKIYEAFDFVEGYKFRRILLGMHDKTITRVIPKLCNNLRKYESTMDGLINTLYVNANNDNVGYRMPKYYEIENSFDRLDMYNKNPKNTSAILKKIERSYATEIINLDNFTIEHIMPQNFSKWDSEDVGNDISVIQYIGNLTLSTIKDNTDMSNNRFEDKKILLEEKSYLHINKEIFKLDTWNHKSIKKRNKDLFNKCMEIWYFEEESYINSMNVDEDELKQTTVIKKKRKVVNKTIRDKKIKLKYDKSIVILPRAQELLDFYDGMYAKSFARSAAKQLGHILYKETSEIILLRDYCIQEINDNVNPEKINKLKKLFNENPELYGDLEKQINLLYELVDKYGEVDLKNQHNLETFCDDLKKFPLFMMMNLSTSNGGITAFMGNMKQRN